ncbi:MAG: PaaI family thioesterase [Sphingorhabdus sp.]
MTDNEREHPFADLIGLSVDIGKPGEASALLTLKESHRNPHGVAHGAVIYAMADTAMGAALHSTLPAESACATLEIKITYCRPVFEGEVTCTATLDHKGKRFGHISSRIECGGKLIALATGNFAILEAPPEKR